MKKIWISLAIIILLVASILFLFPQRSWIMMLHINVFQTDYYLDNEIQQKAPFDVMLSQIVPDTTDQADASKYSFLLYIQQGEQIEEITLKPGETFQKEGYRVGLYQFSYDINTGRYVCFLQFKQRLFRWHKF